MKPGIYATVIKISLIVVIVFAVVVAVRFLFGGPEDTWICSHGAWVMHGKPVAAKPTTPCRD